MAMEPRNLHSQNASNFVFLRRPRQFLGIRFGNPVFLLADSPPHRHPTLSAQLFVGSALRTRPTYVLFLVTGIHLHENVC